MADIFIFPRARILGREAPGSGISNIMSEMLRYNLVLNKDLTPKWNGNIKEKNF